MRISVIIPTLNEAENIGKLIQYLQSHADERLLEIIVVDAQSTDDTEGVALSHGATVLQSERGRAKQMNLGAKHAKGTILYFIHADCLPPETYLADVQKAVLEGFPIGCYRSKFDSRNPLLKMNAFFTRFKPLYCRGGDETLFVTKDVFQELGGYDENYCIMEEYAFIKKAYSLYPFKIIPKYILISARKYETNTWFRVQYANFVAFSMFRKGFSPQAIAAKYQKNLNYRKFENA